MLDPKQRKALQQAIATANDILPRLEYLEQIATAYPELQARAAELRQRRDFLFNLASLAVEAERVLSTNG